jgi:hypothetical protein
MAFRSEKTYHRQAIWQSPFLEKTVAAFAIGVVGGRRAEG